MTAALDPEEQQRRFADFLRRRGDLTRDAEARAFADTFVAGNERLSAVEQLEIYREQFWLRHTASLVEDFPGVGGVLGQADWERLIVGYLESDVLQSHDLRDLGARLSDYVAGQTWLEQRELVHDMARLEWAHVEVFDAADLPRLTPEAIRNVAEDAWEGAKLVLDPALRLLQLRYPVSALRRRLLAAREHDSNATVPLPSAQQSWLAVHRRERLIRHDALEPAELGLLERLAAGEALGAACETAAVALGLTTEALAGELERWFATWSTRGYVVGIIAD